MRGIAVLDVETTGLGRTDRIVEVGVVLMDDQGQTERTFTTLVNPGRDIGASGMHGITASDVVEAPRFGEIAPYLASMLSGRLLVAHNAWFDLSCVYRELSGSSIEVPETLPAVCTLRSASALLGAPTTLEAACSYLSIELANHHSALADAQATAALFRLLAWDMYWEEGLPGRGYFIWDRQKDVGRLLGGVVDEQGQRQEAFEWPLVAAMQSQPSTCSRMVATQRRELADQRIACWVNCLPLGGAETVFSAEYLNLLQQVLMDRQVTENELTALAAMAAVLDLDGASVRGMHQHVLESVASAAWIDGIVTDDELCDLSRVAVLLDLPQASVAAALEKTEKQVGEKRPGILSPGDKVTFTGTMSVDRRVLETLAESVGLTHGDLTKKSAVLVVADPNTESGKAKKAQKYGIPVIAEQTFRYEVEQLR